MNDLLTLLSAQAGVLVGVSVLLGLAIGSFLNVVIHRLPKMMERDWRAQCAWLEGREAEAAPAYNLVLPGSACPQCGHVIRWHENLPVLSWLALRGRCSGCGTAISARYPAVELLTGLLFGYAAWRWGTGMPLLAAWTLLGFLVALAFIDLDTQLLPDSLTLPLAWLGLLANLFGAFAPLEDAVIGAVVGYLVLWGIYHLFRLLTGKEGLGFGDFKLLAALGAWLGWKMLLPVVLAASLMGAVVGIVLIAVAGHDRAKPIPFGPWLALGGVIALFWGDALVRVWLG